MSELDEYMARRQAIAVAEAAIARAAGPRPAGWIRSPVVLMTRFEERADLPKDISVCLMTVDVAATLLGSGLHEPVSLRHLDGKWWRVNVDLAALGLVSEPGCGMTEVVASSDDLRGQYSGYYRQLIAGPFASAEEANERRSR
jgi:hypothetical protein